MEWSRQEYETLGHRILGRSHHLEEGCGRWRGAGHQEYLEAPPQLLLGEEIEEPRSGCSEGGIFLLEAQNRSFCPPGLALSHLGLEAGLVW